MSNSIYVLAPEALVAKSAIALGAIESFAHTGARVGVFRPVIRSEGHDTTLATLLEAADRGQEYADAFGATYRDVRHNPDAAITAIIDKFERVRSAFDAMVILGSDYADVIGPIEFALNAQIAANLNAPALLVVPGRGRTPSDVRHAIQFCLREIAEQCVTPLGVVTVGLDAERVDEYSDELVHVDLPIVLALPGAISMETELPTHFPALVTATMSRIRTPLMFQYQLMKQARADKRTIVLPETEDDRILTAAAIVLERDIANLILLGEETAIHTRAAQLGVDLGRAKIHNPADPELTERFATEYARLRAHKNVTVDQARETLKDSAYFATMMIHMGLADGMVSGAIHTTANTIRPALEFIKTKPGVSLVSGYFLMCLADRVYVFADCAVNPNPTPSDLAEIGLAAAATAASFGIEPRVALLSYSTGTSGTGPDVDAVAEATRLLRERAPELPVEGPIQFDAAVDATVAKTKLPNSTVAGHATVFIFPDLNTGNTTYKAVQRTANALAIGPVLQGLGRPVNDLSRGALVDDIVNTIAITAIQAQADPAAPF